MKKSLLVVFLVLMMVGSVWATPVCTGNSCNTDSGTTTVNAYGGNGGQGGSATIESGAIKNTNTSTNINANTNLNTNTNTNVNAQGQAQKQSQGQLQGQSQTAVGKVTTKVSNNTSIDTPRDAIYVPAINLPIAPILSGKVFRYTLLPAFANKGLTPYNGERVKSILFDSYGNIFSRITVEELPQFLMKKAAEYSQRANVRTDVICKDAGHGLGIGVGGGSSITAADGNSSNGGVLGASGSFAVTNPYCAVWIYQIEDVDSGNASK